MKATQKTIVGLAFTIIAIQFWILTILGKWLTVNDSNAVEQFVKEHQLIGMIAGMLWYLDSFDTRYILILILAIGFWLLFVRPPSKTS